MVTPGSKERRNPIAFFKKAEATITSAFYLVKTQLANSRCEEPRFGGTTEQPRRFKLEMDALPSVASHDNMKTFINFPFVSPFVIGDNHGPITGSVSPLPGC